MRILREASFYPDTLYKSDVRELSRHLDQAMGNIFFGSLTVENEARRSRFALTGRLYVEPIPRGFRVNSIDYGLGFEINYRHVRSWRAMQGGGAMLIMSDGANIILTIS